MCLALIAVGAHPDFPLVVAANRDEFHRRASEPAHRWDRPRGLLAGRDAVGGGTWLGITERGRFGLVTNYRSPGTQRADAPSRGRLLLDYLAGDADARSFAAGLAVRLDEFNGFNLLLGDRDGLYCLSNRDARSLHELDPGIHGLGNRLLNSPEPKLDAARERFAALLPEESDTRGLAGALFALLADDTPHGSDADTPEHPWREALSAIFVRAPGYGTRCSTVLLVGHDRRATFVERRFDAEGRLAGSSAERWRLPAAD